MTKEVDVKLSVRLITLAWSNTVDIIALVAGDGDFRPAVNALEDNKTTVRLYYAKVGKTGVRELTNNNLPELYHFSRIFKTPINAD